MFSGFLLSPVFSNNKDIKNTELRNGQCDEVMELC